MKSIVTVNCELPTIDNYIGYSEGKSLIDYDIVLFEPTFPYYQRIDFSAGGSCVALESGKRLLESVRHWKKELGLALKAGKTVFFLLNAYKVDQVAVSSNSPRKGQRLYDTTQVTNYNILPINISVRNTRGKRFSSQNSNFKGLYEAIKNVVEYQVIIESDVEEKTFVSSDGINVVGSCMSFTSCSGHLVLLPHFDLSNMTERVDDKAQWTDEALRISHSVVGQMVELDSSIKNKTDVTPKPEWLDAVELPKEALVIEGEIDEVKNKVLLLQQSIEEKVVAKSKLLKYANLLFEKGILLEESITNTLGLMGYIVENYREGDLEIDHIIVGPSKIRMIGETEGKDTSAISITKFRQLESNINEDFEREVVDDPAKGILFGNGYRLQDPSAREGQFTEKCLKNAKRLGTALVRTSDLYDVALYLLNHPHDEEYKLKCRDALEKTTGEIVSFPETPTVVVQDT